MPVKHFKAKIPKVVWLDSNGKARKTKRKDSSHTVVSDNGQWVARQDSNDDYPEFQGHNSPPPKYSTATDTSTESFVLCPSPGSYYNAAELHENDSSKAKKSHSQNRQDDATQQINFGKTGRNTSAAISKKKSKKNGPADHPEVADLITFRSVDEILDGQGAKLQSARLPRNEQSAIFGEYDKKARENAPPVRANIKDGALANDMIINPAFDAQPVFSNERPSVVQRAIFPQKQFGNNAKRTQSIPEPSIPAARPTPSEMYLVAEAMHDFHAIRPTDLSFHRGDRIVVVRQRPDMNCWWEGIVGNRRGEFPANYIRMLDE